MLVGGSVLVFINCRPSSSSMSVVVFTRSRFIVNSLSTMPCIFFIRPTLRLPTLLLSYTADTLHNPVPSDRTLTSNA